MKQMRVGPWVVLATAVLVGFAGGLAGMVAAEESGFHDAHSNRKDRTSANRISHLAADVKEGKILFSSMSGNAYTHRKDHLCLSGSRLFRCTVRDENNFGPGSNTTEPGIGVYT